VKRGTPIAVAVALLASLAAFLSLVPRASAQRIARKPLAEEHLEHMQDPPATIVPRRLQLSPQKISSFGPFTSYQANVDANGNNIVGDAANEPSICVDPTNSNRMSIGWRQFNSVTSNFRQAGWGYSTNGGLNWTFPGVLQNNVFRSDPVLSSDSNGQFYYLSLLTTFFDDMFRSLSGGATWQILGGATGGDKQWFTIDNTPTSPGFGFQYQCWSTAGNNYQGRQFSRSTNGGFSWRDPVNIPRTPIWGTLDVDTTGNLFIGGVNPDTGQIWCIRSSNAKNAAVTPTFDLTTAVDMGGNIAGSEIINPEGLVGQINVAIDRSGTSTNNYIYLAASLQRTGVFNGSDVMFVRSTNGGQTFGAPVRINDDALNANKWHWLAALSVAPGGRIDCVWLDSRNAVNNTDSQLFYSFSNDAGQTWSPNVPVTGLFNPFIGYPNQNKMGDYITVVSDNDGANVAYAATFNGEEDVYFIHIPASICAASQQDITEAIDVSCTPAYTVSLTVGSAGGTGFVTGSGHYANGTPVSAIATPNQFFTFSNWSENGVIVSTSPTYNFTASGNRNLVANFAPIPVVTATPIITPSAGTFKHKVKFKITCSTPGAVIYFTVDGSDPTTASAVFPTPAKKKQKVKRLTLNGTGVRAIKAMAIAPGFNQSPISTATYTLK
jgi:hypothetical protein